jgi:hypothetical protein
VTFYQKSGLAAVCCLLLALSPAPLSAEDESFLATGNDFLSNCDASGDLKELVCLGYVRGYISGHISGTMSARYVISSWGRKTTDLPQSFCLPTNFDYKQVVDVVLRFLRDKPNLRHEPLGLLMHHALRTGFPCADTP